MKKLLLTTILLTLSAIVWAQKNQDDAIMTPDGDIILSEVTIETIDVQEKQVWETSHFYELDNNNGRYELKNGTKQEIARKIELNGKEKTLRVYGKKNTLKMHHDIEEIVRSENQMILEFTNGSFMIIDNKNRTISLFETNFGFVYKMKD